jgi:prophage tail gpP-like protein
MVWVKKMSGVVELKVKGGIFSGWERMEIKTGIEQIAGTFQLDITERWPGQDTPTPIMPGFDCEVLLDGATVITGYVDSSDLSYDENSHTVSIAGRDKTGDLVDCSAVYKTGQWANRDLFQIAVDICKPFKINVIKQADVGAPFSHGFSLNDGERAFEALDRMARMRAVLLVSDGLGNLIITRAGQQRVATDLVEGVNIKRAQGKFDWKERFRQYVIKGQHRVTDGETVDAAAGPSGKAADTVITRYRPLLVLAEDQGHIASLAQRAEWEKNVRIGRANRATITVQGWSHADGLWRPNSLVRLRSPMLYADIDLLIAQVTYKLDSNGTTTELELCRPEAFDLIAGVKGNRLDRAISQKKHSGAAVRVAGDKKSWQKANAGGGYVSAIESTPQGEGWK